jgi:hypothetical protein
LVRVNYLGESKIISELQKEKDDRSLFVLKLMTTSLDREKPLRQSRRKFSLQPTYKSDDMRRFYMEPKDMKNDNEDLKTEKLISDSDVGTLADLYNTISLSSERINECLNNYSSCDIQESSSFSMIETAKKLSSDDASDKTKGVIEIEYHDNYLHIVNNHSNKTSGSIDSLNHSHKRSGSIDIVNNHSLNYFHKRSGSIDIANNHSIKSSASIDSLIPFPLKFRCHVGEDCRVLFMPNNVSVTQLREAIKEKFKTSRLLKYKDQDGFTVRF